MIMTHLVCTNDQLHYFVSCPVVVALINGHPSVKWSEAAEHLQTAMKIAPGQEREGQNIRR